MKPTLARTAVGEAAAQAVELTYGLGLLARSGVVGPMRPDRALGIAQGYLRWGLSMATGYAAGAARHPDRAAVVDDRGMLTFAQVHQRSDRLARALADRGVGETTKIAVLSGNMNHFGDVLYNPYGSTEVSWVCIADSTHLRADPPPPARHPWAPS